MELKKEFRIGDPVRVSAAHGWPGAPVGVVSSGPAPVNTLQGEDYYYWVRFNPPVRDDDGDGPYKSVQVLSRALVLVDGDRREIVDPGYEARTSAYLFGEPISELEPENQANCDNLKSGADSHL